jgi:hypothetical protein
VTRQAGVSAGPSGAEAQPPRPALVDTVAALFVFGGLFGASQLLVGDFVVTGSLPAKGPIVGVAAFLYGASVILGFFLRLGRYWLPSINLAVLFAIAYLPAFGQPVAVILGAAHAVAAVILFRERRWFTEMTARRTGRPIGAPRAAPRAASAASAAGRRRRDQGSRRPPGSK